MTSQISSSQDLPQLWQTATVPDVQALDEAGNLPYASFVLPTEQAMIFSRDPVVDYEINAKGISGWKMILQDANETLGVIDYFIALERLDLEQQILDEKEGSILIPPLSRTEVLALLETSSN